MAVTGSRLFFAFMLSALSGVLLLLTGCSGTVSPVAPQVATTSAFVCVSTNPGGNNSEIQAFSADSSGQLTPVPDSPFAAKVESMAVNGKFLFGTDGSNIFSFSIASNGTLTQVSSINAVQSTPSGYVADLFLDRAGSTLYDKDYHFDGANDGYQSFNIDGSTGALTNLGGVLLDDGGGVLSVMGNNVNGYTPNNYHFNCRIDGFKRNNDGALAYGPSQFTPDLPGGPAGDSYCAGAIAADHANHLTIALMEGVDGSFDGTLLLAVFTADSSGNLTTNSTFSSTPQAATGLGDIQISSSGKFLATSGPSGLQVFHFNEADPITPLTGLLTNAPVDQVAWDNNSHLYAISKSTNQLFVFSVTSTSAIQSPGSPYTITNPGIIVVQPQM